MIITIPNFNPVALAIGPLEIRWYSLAYIAGIIFVMLWLKKCNQKEGFLTKQAYDDWIMWSVFSIIIGGRFGYVLFYNFGYFVSHPLEIFSFWKGGMSFHGGLLGAIVGMWFYAKKFKINYLLLTDRISVAAPFGLLCGRIANFINLELYGRITNGDFGVIFPNAGELPRHPSQLYEALLEGLFLLFFMNIIYRKTRISDYRGSLSGLFLIGYSISRLIVENFREPDEQVGFLFEFFTMGQILCLPLFFGGIFLLYRSKNSKNFKKTVTKS